MPNRFGEQRFGAGGDNAAAGLAILRGERRERDQRRRSSCCPPLQSAVFNRALELRAAPRARSPTSCGGDVLQKTDSGGLFVTNDPAVDQPRVDAGEVVPTGPLPGGREKEPPPGTPARADRRRGDRLRRRDARGLLARGPRAAGRAPRGRCSRRATRPSSSRTTPDGPVRFRFSLPSGGYATVFVDATASRDPQRSALRRTTPARRLRPRFALIAFSGDVESACT